MIDFDILKHRKEIFARVTELDASNAYHHLNVMEPLIAMVIHIDNNRVISREELDKILIDATEV